MALASYTDLQASISAWMVRTDLAAVIPDFVAIAESRINADVRLRQGISSGSLSTVIGAQSVALPADWLEFESLTDNGRQMEYISPSEMRDRIDEPATLNARMPARYCIDGTNLLLTPTPAEVRVLAARYYAAIPPLASSATNWLLTKYPNIYLYASLVSGYQYLYGQAVSVAQGADERAQTSGSKLTVRTRYPR
jgi:hypothetical protein